MGWARAVRRANANPAVLRSRGQQHVFCGRSVFCSEAEASSSSSTSSSSTSKPATKRIQQACPWHGDEHRNTMHSVQTTLPFASRFLDEMGLRTVPPKNFETAVNEAFDAIDKDHDNHITRGDLKAILQDRIYNCSEDCAAGLDKELQALGAGNPGQEVSRDEFQKIVSDMSEKLDERVWPATVLSGIGGLCFAMSGTLTPVLSQELGFSAATFGGIIAMMPLVRVASTIPTTIAAEVVGRKPLMTGGSAIITAGFVLNAMIVSPAQFIVARLVSGIGTGALSVGTQNYIADISTSKNRSRSYAPGQMAGTVGFAVGPTLAGILSDCIGTRPSFVALSCGMAVSTFLSQKLLPETLRKRDKSMIGQTGRESKGLAIETFHRWKELLSDRGLRHMVLSNCGMNATSITARYVVLPMTALNYWDFSASQLGILLGSMSLIQGVSHYPAAWISDRFGRMVAFAPGMAIISLSLACASMVTPENATHLIPCMAAGWSVGQAFIATVPTAFAVDRANHLRGGAAKNQAQALALMRMTGDLAMAIGAAAAGSMMDAMGPSTSFSIFGVGLAGVAAATARSTRHLNMMHKAAKAVQAKKNKTSS